MTSHFSRLLWKESRALRGLRLVHLAMVVLLAFGAPLPVVSLWQLAPLLTIPCVTFGFASAAMQFAGEEEHGTARWLRLLPMRTSTLLNAKLAAVAVGTVGLFIVGFVVSGLRFAVLNLQTPHAQHIRIAEAPTAHDVTLVAGDMFFCIVMAVVLSLVNRRILGALAWTGAFAGVYLTLRFRGATPALLYLCIPAFLLIPIAGRRWHLGLRGKRRDLIRSARAAGIATAVSGKWAVFWQRRLEWCVRCRTAASRTRSVLLWRELRMATVWCGVWLFAAPFLYCLPQWDLRFLFLRPLVGVAVVDAGLRCFRHDQQQDRRFFLVYRAVSPTLVWIVRTCVWLPAACLAVAFMLAADYAAFRYAPVVNALRDDSLSRWLIDSAGGPGWRGQLAFQGFIAWFIGSFAVGQLCSFWIRRPLVAMFCALAGCVMLSEWTASVTDLGQSMALLVWPVTISAWAAILWTGRTWLERRASGTGQVLRWVAVSACLLGVWRFSHLLWATEIPLIRDESLTSRQTAAQLGYSEENASGDWADTWNRFCVAARDTHHIVESDPDAFRAIRDGDQSEAVKLLDALDEQIGTESRDRHLPPHLRVPWLIREPVVSATQILHLEAHRQHSEQQPEAVLHRLKQAVRFQRYFLRQSSGFSGVAQVAECEVATLRYLRKTVADDRIAADQLRALRDELGRTLKAEPDFGAMEVNRFVVFDQLLNRHGYLWSEYHIIRELNRLTDNPDATLSANDDVLDDLVAAGRVDRTGTLRQLLKDRFGVSPGDDFRDNFPVELIESSRSDGTRVLRLLQPNLTRQVSVTPGDWNRWMQTRPGKESGIPLDLSYDLDDSAGQWLTHQIHQRLINHERAMLTVLALQEYRRRFGEFPASLLKLSAVGIPRDSPLLFDADTETRFGYAPDGYGVKFERPGGDVRIEVIPFDQPILWSHGQAAPAKPSQRLKSANVRIRPTNPGWMRFLDGTGDTASGFATDYYGTSQQ